MGGGRSTAIVKPPYRLGRHQTILHLCRLNRLEPLCERWFRLASLQGVQGNARWCRCVLARMLAMLIVRWYSFRQEHTPPRPRSIVCAAQRELGNKLALRCLSLRRSKHSSRSACQTSCGRLGAEYVELGVLASRSYFLVMYPQRLLGSLLRRLSDTSQCHQSLVTHEHHSSHTVYRQRARSPNPSAHTPPLSNL